MQLDKYWQMSGLICPFCGTRLLNDTHEEKDSTHYCSNCNMGLLIVGNTTLRGIK